MSDNASYGPGDLVLVWDQYQPLNPIPAVFEQYEPVTARAKVVYRESGHVAWIDANRIIGLDNRARREPDDR